MKIAARSRVAVTASVIMCAGLPTQVHSQTYPIDCAILLCLSGGWPASEPCARARAEFISRITPWPVEPPLQIWRCPMAASYQARDGDAFEARIYDILYPASPAPLPWSPLSGDEALQLTQDRADIDISGREFDFVRSIRVYHVRYASQREAGREGDEECRRVAEVSLGIYGTQGEFGWRPSSIDALPAAHRGLTGWGDDCPGIWHRSVFVDWQDFEGRYGFEQVNY